jgi:hypothetical protein
LHFKVRNEAFCQVSDERKCEPEDAIVSFYIFNHHWLYFSNHSAIYQIYLSNFTLMTAIESYMLMKNKYDIQNYDCFILYLKYKNVNEQQVLICILIWRPSFALKTNERFIRWQAMWWNHKIKLFTWLLTF